MRSSRKSTQPYSRYLPLYLHNSLNSISSLIPYLSLIVLVVDSRAPQLKELYISEIKKKWAGKNILTIFSKKDLVESENKKNGENYSFNLLKYSARREIIRLIYSSLKNLNLSAKETTNSLLVVGGANSGKSSLINLLIGKKKVKSCSEAGTTRYISRHKIPSTNLIIYDTPGLFPAKLKFELKTLLQLLAFMPVGKEGKENYEEWSFKYLLKNYPRELQKLSEGEENLLSPDAEGYFSFLSTLAKKYSLLEKGGSLSLKRAEEKFIHLIRTGKIGKIVWKLDDLSESY